MKEREKLSSRLGFILISAGCAVGLGNVWRFPFITGQYGGGAFVLIYLFFLILLGLPIMVMEFSVGRASRKSVSHSFDVLEPKGTRWHGFKAMAVSGNYILMMFYTVDVYKRQAEDRQTVVVHGKQILAGDQHLAGCW